MKIIIAILMFCVIVIAHEMGHFLLAKMNGIAVSEFAIGLGPTILSFTKAETKYSLKLIPFGGACIFDDADPENITESTFLKASVWSRISVIAAGPIFNFILAFIFSLFVVGMVGYDLPVIAEISPGSGAQEAGLREGDLILKIGGEHVKLYREVMIYSYINQQKSTEVVYERDGEKYHTVMTQSYDEELGRYLYGMTGGAYTKSSNPLTVIKYSFFEVRYWIKSTLKSLGMLVQGKITKDDVSGPVGITQMVGDVYEEAKPAGLSMIIVSMLDIAILISANLGVMNLLPLPALDGGRLVFMFIEVIRRKPISPEKEGIVHFIGFALLMILMVFVLFNDITRIDVVKNLFNQ
ncbi:MAG: RIP metalloprotease RseP [Clostridia bacterium]|nr:RIP metalloprotease RseP [Clostridia bacterium]